MNPVINYREACMQAAKYCDVPTNTLDNDMQIRLRFISQLFNVPYRNVEQYVREFVR